MPLQHKTWATQSSSTSMCRGLTFQPERVSTDLCIHNYICRRVEVHKAHYTMSLSHPENATIVQTCTDSASDEYCTSIDTMKKFLQIEFNVIRQISLSCHMMILCY